MSQVADDVVIVGAGPAGAVAATVLARAGARVRILDRAVFPRDKLCGDTVNPGALRVLRRLGLAADVEARGLPVRGMRVTGEGGASVEGRYPGGLAGRALERRHLDWLLVQQALEAGARFEPGVAVRAPIVDGADGDRVVTGVEIRAGHRRLQLRAPVVIAADGRRSRLAFGLGLARPSDPRRWAVGGYFDRGGLAELGEMHVRRGRYLGVAAVPGGVTNVCLVKPVSPGELSDPAGLLTREILADALLRDRFVDARLVTAPVVLGPLAVDVPVRPHAMPAGLLLAGDAAGFIDPMTGDGLRFAIRGGELAAVAAMEVLAAGWEGVQARLAEARRREFGAKWRFNRALRALVSSPAALHVATAGAQLLPGAMRAVIIRAGDCGDPPANPTPYSLLPTP
jgi:flavin-dependent dehydrogenase